MFIFSLVIFFIVFRDYCICKFLWEKQINRKNKSIFLKKTSLENTLKKPNQSFLHVTMQLLSTSMDAS